MVWAQDSSASGELSVSRAATFFDRYALHHRNPVNKAVHWICVPLIVWSLMGLLWSVAPLAAYVAIGVALSFYLWLSIPIALGMAAVLLAMLYALTVVGERTLLVSAIVFVTAWIGQFVGHSIEGSRPTFVEDVRFFLVGPAWLLGFVYRRLGIAY
jgi:uncharacterized membrane protein YGL010W